MIKNKLIKKSRAIHHKLMWIALGAVGIFVLSALMHPLMVWTGPQPQQHRPPTLTIKANDLKNLNALITQWSTDPAFKSRLKAVNIAKVVATSEGPMLQITFSDSLSKGEGRSYWPIASHRSPMIQSLKHFDKLQAVWLARYYSNSQAGIKSIDYINEFSDEYPSVNRLIPVYKVSFDDPDQTAVFIHTETNALAAINNAWKVKLQTVFRWLHTFSWLDQQPVLRVALMLLLLATLFAMSITGLMKLVLIRRKHIPNRSRKLHRVFSWLVLVPFLGMLISAGYHLIQNQFADNYRGMRLTQTVDLTGLTIHVPENIAHQDLNELSIVNYQGQRIVRASVSNEKMTEPVTRNQHFDGIEREKNAYYFDPLNGALLNLTDEEFVNHIALDYLGLTSESIIATTRINRFSSDYDFRNKRLPVYKVELQLAMGDRLFIDPKAGVLVDRLVNSQRYEGYSFSILHKWNFLVPAVGRQGRDVAIVGFLICLMLLSGLGVMVKFMVAQQESST